MVCLLNSCLYVMFRSCFESLASVVTIKLVRAAHCGAPRIAAHRTYMGSCREKNDWQFSNPRIHTVDSIMLRLEKLNVLDQLVDQVTNLTKSQEFCHESITELKWENVELKTRMTELGRDNTEQHRQRRSTMMR